MPRLAAERDGISVWCIVNGRYAENCYILSSTQQKSCLVIDPGSESALILAEIASRKCEVQAILATHAHFDHVGAAGEIQAKTGAPFYLHPADLPLLRQAPLYAHVFKAGAMAAPPESLPLPIESGMAWCGQTVRILETPGHTPGGVCYGVGDILFTGDVLMAGKIGRSALPGGDNLALFHSLQELFKLPSETVVLPGHGSPTTIGAEKGRRNERRPERAA